MKLLDYIGDPIGNKALEVPKRIGQGISEYGILNQNFSVFAIFSN